MNNETRTRTLSSFCPFPCSPFACLSVSLSFFPFFFLFQITFLHILRSFRFLSVLPSFCFYFLFLYLHFLLFSLLFSGLFLKNPSSFLPILLFSLLLFPIFTLPFPIPFWPFLYSFPLLSYLLLFFLNVISIPSLASPVFSTLLSPFFSFLLVPPLSLPLLTLPHPIPLFSLFPLLLSPSILLPLLLPLPLLLSLSLSSPSSSLFPYL